MKAENFISLVLFEFSVFSLLPGLSHPRWARFFFSVILASMRASSPNTWGSRERSRGREKVFPASSPLVSLASVWPRYVPFLDYEQFLNPELRPSSETRLIRKWRRGTREALFLHFRQ